ncbi:MAG: protoporphyrinogen oxidase [Chloroflexi bacterium]|nr:protoporphyrinogen oxidase [Chloroflexota bacterium]
MDAPHIVIVGGGMAGLGLAYALVQRQADVAQPWRITVVDAQPRWGGVVRTVMEDGFVVEGGPDSVLAFKPAAVRLWRALGLDEAIMGTDPRYKGAFVFARGRLHRLPEGLTLMVPSQLGPLFRTSLLSWKGKLRAALDLVPRRVAPPDGDISVADFIAGHLGHEVMAYIVEPLFAGIYAGDARRLSVAATYPQLLELERRYGSLLWGLFAARRARARRDGANPQRTRSAFVTLRRGLTQGVEALVAALKRANVRLVTSAPVTRVHPTAQGWRVETERGTMRANAVVLALPAWKAARLVEGFDPALADALYTIPYASTATVSLAYRATDIAHPMPGYGFVVPRVEGRPLVAGTWTTRKFPHRSPEGTVLIRLFLGRAGNDRIVHADEAEIAALARQELADIMGVRAEPLRTWVFRWPRVLPQYEVGHAERVRAIQQRARGHPGLYLLSNAWDGVGIPDRLAAAERLATELTRS